MALWDSADLLQRCIDAVMRSPGETNTAEWRARMYRFLTEAQSEWINTIAAVVPDAMRSPPRRMVSTDGGYTYEFRDGNDAVVFPIGHAEIRERRDGAVLTPCTDLSLSGDYVPEGDRIRVPNGQTRTWSDGPWARFVEPGGVIDANTQPTLKPAHARVLVVYRACAKWARMGGFRDPQPYLDAENEAWFGNPATGVVGILGALRTQHALTGIAQAVDPAAWWRNNPDLGGPY